MSSPNVQLISECFIKPQNISHEPVHFSPFDLSMLSLEYIQKGLLFSKPSPSSLPSPPQNHHDFSITTFLEKLKQTLSTTLTHFYPLAGLLVTRKQENPHSHIIYLDPDIGPGAKFIHVKLDLTVSDILSPVDVPSVVRLFFDKDKAINHDGHTMPLLSVQVTELVDGIFISCSINHVMSDGTSFWHFFNTWSELFNGLYSPGTELPNMISRPPIHHRRWYDAIVNLPFTRDEQFLKRPVTPILRERIFHFSTTALSNLKAKANSQSNITTGQISTLQALTAHLWCCITRARTPLPDQKTTCLLAVNSRSRFNPKLTDDYVGNYVQSAKQTVTVRELLERDDDIGWAAKLLNLAIASQDEETVREYVEGWVKSPRIPALGSTFPRYDVLVGSSPRFNIYGTEFGLGKALALRSGGTNKFCGKVTVYPGREGGGSIDLEISLSPDTMVALESDNEFTAAFSF